MKRMSALVSLFVARRRALVGIAAALLLPSCVGGWSGTPMTGARAYDADIVAAEVTEKLVALPGAGEKTRSDARRVANEAVSVSQQLAREYRIVRPAGLHNSLVNTKRRERGLCWQWMEDLYPRMRSLNVKDFDFVCAVRDTGRLFREHHCVVAVPKGRSFNDGLVLDPWEKGGHLIAFPVNGAKRPWHFDSGNSFKLDNLYRQTVSKRR
jgi:hypothetical protein